MPKKKFEGTPFPTVVRIDTDTPILIDRVSDVLRNHPNGASICIRSANGHPNRGGYFFHILPIDNGECELYNFEKILVATLSIEQITIFMNHCSGLEFHEWAFLFCQSIVNFRLDPAEPESAEAEAAEKNSTNTEPTE